MVVEKRFTAPIKPSIGEIAHECQVVAYEEPAAEYHIVGVLLEKEPDSEVYCKIVENMLGAQRQEQDGEAS